MNVDDLSMGVGIFLVFVIGGLIIGSLIGYGCSLDMVCSMSQDMCGGCGLMDVQNGSECDAYVSGYDVGYVDGFRAGCVNQEVSGSTARN